MSGGEVPATRMELEGLVRVAPCRIDAVDAAGDERLGVRRGVDVEQPCGDVRVLAGDPHPSGHGRRSQEREARADRGRQPVRREAGSLVARGRGRARRTTEHGIEGGRDGGVAAARERRTSAPRQPCGIRSRSAARSEGDGRAGTDPDGRGRGTPDRRSPHRPAARTRPLRGTRCTSARSATARSPTRRATIRVAVGDRAFDLGPGERRGGFRTQPDRAVRGYLPQGDGKLLVGMRNRRELCGWCPAPG
jgi:hypothetical protein